MGCGTPKQQFNPENVGAKPDWPFVVWIYGDKTMQAISLAENMLDRPVNFVEIAIVKRTRFPQLNDYFVLLVIQFLFKLDRLYTDKDQSCFTT